MIDIWGAVWLIIAIIVFPFGYKPIVLLLSISSIFQASKMITLAGVNFPLFFCIEFLTFLRLCLPHEGNGIIPVNNKKFFLILILILMIWFQTLMNTFIFEGLKVFSSSLGSNEYSVAIGGTPLFFGSPNINQLVLLSMNLLLAAAFYVRRKSLNKDYYLKTILISVLIFSFVSLLWKFTNQFYNKLSLFFYNNDYYSITAYYENRLSGTFSEPSFAGLFIGTFMLAFLFSANNKVRFLGVILFFLGFLNLSSTFLFVSFVSILILMLGSRKIEFKFLFFIIGFLGILIFFIAFQEYFLSYINTKSTSESGNVRSAVNIHILNNILNSYFMGVGLGSERASSLILTMINNLGIILSGFLIYGIYFLLDKSNDFSSKLLFICLLCCFFGSFVSMQEITIPILWNLIFANIVYGSQKSNTDINLKKFNG